MGLSATSPHRAQLQLDGGSEASASVFVGDRGLCIWKKDTFHRTIGIRKSQLARRFDFAKHVRRRMDPRLRTWAKEIQGSPEGSTAMTMPLWPPGSEESSARHGSPAAPREESQRGAIASCTLFGHVSPPNSHTVGSWSSNFNGPSNQASALASPDPSRLLYSYDASLKPRTIVTCRSSALVAAVTLLLQLIPVWRPSTASMPCGCLSPCSVFRVALVTRGA